MFETTKKNDFQQHNYESKLGKCFPVNFVLTSSLPSAISSSVIITVAQNNNCCTGNVKAARQSSTEISSCACVAQTVRMDMTWLITLCNLCFHMNLYVNLEDKMSALLVAVI